MADQPAWRDHYPVAWAEDDLVNRREFTKSLAVVSCAAFCATSALAARALTRADEPRREVRVASVTDLPVGGSLVFAYPAAGDHCLLVRRDDGSFAAYAQACTHLGCPVVYEAEERRFHCPCHAGFFSVEDGRVLAGPPPRPLPRIRLERRGDSLWAVGREA